MEALVLSITRFQHTAARRRLVPNGELRIRADKVSTHSRPKAAGLVQRDKALELLVSTHSRPKAAGKKKP